MADPSDGYASLWEGQTTGGPVLNGNILVKQSGSLYYRGFVQFSKCVSGPITSATLYLYGGYGGGGTPETNAITDHIYDYRGVSNAYNGIGVYANNIGTIASPSDPQGWHTLVVTTYVANDINANRPSFFRIRRTDETQWGGYTFTSNGGYLTTSYNDPNLPYLRICGGTYTPADSDGDLHSDYWCGGNDCDDTDPTIYTSATEICDGKDNDCDRKLDEGCDSDLDGYIDSGMTCSGTPRCADDGGIAPGICNGCSILDCDDTDSSINPGATEICDGLDNDCDGQTDEGCDDDNDNYCDSSMTRVGTPSTCTAVGGDCNDDVSLIHPGAAEICGNGIDEDCSGADLACAAPTCNDLIKNQDETDIDCGGTVCPACAVPPPAEDFCEGCNGWQYVSSTGLCWKSYYPDLKTYSEASTACSNDGSRLPTLEEGQDACDFFDLRLSPWANGWTTATYSTGHRLFHDRDHNGDYCALGVSMDCSNPACISWSTNDITRWFACVKPPISDTDNDGYVGACDCNDIIAAIHPGATETCDGLDNDCDGQIDEALTTSAGCTQVGACSGAVKTCTAGSWGVCSKLPATEICDDGIDQDCNGADLPCPPCTITDAYWITPDLKTTIGGAYIVSDNTPVVLRVEGDYCDRESVALNLWEDDTPSVIDGFGDFFDDKVYEIWGLTRTFSGGVATYEWPALYTTHLLSNPFVETETGQPEYYFVAELTNGETKKSGDLIVTGNIPPTAPANFLIKPNGGEYYDQSLNVTWNPASDPDDDALEYKIEYSADSGNTWNTVKESYGHDNTVEYNGEQKDSLVMDFG